MAPGGGGKRKRSDRQVSQDDNSPRPSPHRPEHMSMAQQGEPRGSRGSATRSSRRQSRQGVQSPVNGANAAPLGARSTAPPSPVARGQPRQMQKVAGEVSRPASPAAPAVQPVQNAPNEEPLAPYFYEQIMDEHIAEWDGSGRETVQNIANAADELRAIAVVEELTRSSLDGRLNTSEAGSVLRTMIAHHSGESGLDIQTLFFNVICILDEADWKSANLLALISASNVDPELLRQEMDIEPMKTLALVRPSFQTMRTRKTTNILYRQANFNLLREESEGYAKLVTEYFNTSNESVKLHDVSAEDAFQRVMALVGSFDLDVGRVLDITLDISANALVRAYDFFVKFYRCSSWWPSEGVIDNVKYEPFEPCPTWAIPGYGLHATEDELERMKQAEKAALEPAKTQRDARFWQEVKTHGMQPYFALGSRPIVDFDVVLPSLEAAFPAEHDSKGKEVNPDKRKRIDEDRKYMRTTGLLPPQGNPDAAQLLGFKFRFYASAARDESDVLSENLVHLAALLIKIGFISLRDLYPHLCPADDAMQSEKTRLEKEKTEKEAKERPGGGTNALASAGALPDDTAPTVRYLRNDKERSGASTPKQEKKEDEPKVEPLAPTNQKIALLKALLLVGALPEALYILGRFPWLVDADTTLPPYLHRIAKRMLSKVADSIRPMRDRASLQASRASLSDNAAKPDRTLPVKTTSVPKGSRWLGLDQVDGKDGLAHRHYYPDWDDNIPLCQNIDDVFSLCSSFLGYLGVKIGQDADLLATLVRIAKHSLTEDFSTPNRSRWLELMKTLLVPSLSVAKHNPGLTQAVYELLKMFPTATRYNIYAEWYSGKTSRLPDMRVAFDHSKAEVKDVLRRVTNDTGKKQARALAKITFSSPGIVMTSMINQLESYSNMIPSLVECTRYFSFLAYDVLTWCLINSLSGQGRNRMQGDGMLTSPWLQALSQFVASLFYRYSVINPSPVLQYLASELRHGSTTDLELFEQVLAEMGGIRPDLDFNDAQVLAMAGGEHLRSITVEQLHDKRHTRKEKAARLLRALSEPGLTSQMLISIAQERQMYANHDSSKFMPLKVLGNNLDKIQQVFAQYLEVLKANIKPADLEVQLPNVITLVGELGIRPGTAFTIARTSIMYRIAEHDAGQKTELAKSSPSQEYSQVNGDVEMRDEGQPTVFKEPAASVEQQQEGTGDKPGPHPWHPVLQPLIDGLSQIASDLAENVSIPYFVTFWTLSLQDILVHPGSYEAELARLRLQISDLTPKDKDRSKLSGVALKDMERKRNTLSELQDKLRDELKGRIGTYQKTRNRLSKSEKDHWFARGMDKTDINARHLGLLQECFLPRAMLSSLDAHYCFLMLKLLHDNGTPGFSTMHLLNHLLKKQQLAAIIFQCTPMEAQHFGRFLCEILKLLQHWHSDKSSYEKEAFGKERHLPGFAKKLDAAGKPEAHLEFEEFRRLLFNWHTYLNGSLQSCVDSGEYMHIRNGFIILRAIVPVFPTINFMGHNMVKQITKLSEDDPRQDLKLAAMSLLGPLKHREKSWMMPQAFRLNDSSKEAGRSGSRQPSARPETPQPGQSTPKLDATAPEFKPEVSSLTNGALRKESVATKEDGEVEDEKQAAIKREDVGMKDATAVKQHTSTSQPGDTSQDRGTANETDHLASTVTAREGDVPSANPSTPSAMPVKPPAVDPPRTTPSSSRAAHTLPSRPERHGSRPPNRPLPTPPTDRGHGRLSGRVDDRYGRLDKPGDMRPGSRDHSPGRSRGRSPEREAYYNSRGPPRDDRGPPMPSRGPHDGRYAREEQWPRSSAPNRPPPYDSRGRVGGASSVPVNQPAPPTREPLPPSNAYNAPPSVSRPPSSNQQQHPSQTSTAHSENPARLALINNDSSQSRDRGRDAPKEVREERQAGNRSPPSGRALPLDPPRDPQSRVEEATDLAPNGPRRGRSSRELGHPAQPESSYGRLNGSQEVPAAVPPRAPNGPSGRGARTYPNGGLPPSTRPNEQSLPAPAPSRIPESAATPRGPSARAHAQSERRSSGPWPERQQSSSSIPTTAAPESGPSVHPDRMNRLDMQTPPLHASMPPSISHPAPSPTSAPPSGPRSTSYAPPKAPTGPSAAFPPSGPSASNERPRRTAGQLADINATLTSSQGVNGSNSQGVIFRGAAQSRQGAPASSANAQPSVVSSMDPPPRRSEPGRRRDDRPEAANVDLFAARQDHGTGLGSRTGSRMEASSERHHSSRHSSRDHKSDDAPPVRPPPPGMSNADDRRALGREERREREDPRDGGSMRAAPRNDEASLRRGQGGPAPYGPPQGPPQEWNRSGDRRGMGREPLDDGRGGRSGMRHEEYRGGRREEDRRPLPPPHGPPMVGPGGRKRRHEEAPFEGEKRRRSGK